MRLATTYKQFALKLMACLTFLLIFHFALNQTPWFKNFSLRTLSRLSSWACLLEPRAIPFLRLKSPAHASATAMPISVRGPHPPDLQAMEMHACRMPNACRASAPPTTTCALPRSASQARAAAVTTRLARTVPRASSCTTRRLGPRDRSQHPHPAKRATARAMQPRAHTVPPSPLRRPRVMVVCVHARTTQWANTAMCAQTHTSSTAEWRSSRPPLVKLVRVLQPARPVLFASRMELRPASARASPMSCPTVPARSAAPASGALTRATPMAAQHARAMAPVLLLLSAATPMASAPANLTLLACTATAVLPTPLESLSRDSLAVRTAPAM